MTEHSRPPPGADLGAIDDPSIPVLTERIYLPAVELDTALPASLLPPQPPEAPDEAHGAPEQAAPEQVATAMAVAPREAFSGAVDVLGDPAIIVPPAAGETPPRLDAAEEDAVATQVAGAIEAAPSVGDEPGSPVDRLMPESRPAEVTAAADATWQASGEPEPIEHAATAVVAPTAAVDPAALQAALETKADALRVAVLQRVSERLPEQVAATVRDLMQPAIDQAMARLGEEAQVALRITLQDLVEQALREELARGPGDAAAR